MAQQLLSILQAWQHCRHGKWRHGKYSLCLPVTLQIAQQRPVAPRLLEPTKQSRHARLLDGSGGTHARRDAHRRRRPERPRRAAAAATATARSRRLRLRLLLRLLPGCASEHKSLEEREADLHHLKG